MFLDQYPSPRATPEEGGGGHVCFENTSGFCKSFRGPLIDEDSLASPGEGRLRGQGQRPDLHLWVIFRFKQNEDSS
jgi:hypothetical protein